MQSILDSFIELWPSSTVAILVPEGDRLHIAPQANMQEHIQQCFREVTLKQTLQAPDISFDEGRRCYAIQLLAFIPGEIGGIVAIKVEKNASRERPPKKTEDDLYNLARTALEGHKLRAELARHSQYDPPTGLPNRLLFEDRLMQAIARAKRQATRVGVGYIDVDHFTDVNGKQATRSGMPA